ncbi:hypothetical protein GA0115260_121813, partial [Streptomyces sp. MnatMP-M27]
MRHDLPMKDEAGEADETGGTGGTCGEPDGASAAADDTAADTEAAAR